MRIQVRFSNQRWFWLVNFLILGIVLISQSKGLASGFDFPLGKPDGIGYGVQGLGGLVFLEPYDYGGQCGWTFHPGEDWNADGSGLDFGGDKNDAGDPVYAVSDGVITHAEFAGNSWGFVVLIQHDGNFSLPEGGQISQVWSQYGHLSSISVNPRTAQPWKPGDTVLRNEHIGNVGDFPHNSGSAFHLHFEIRKIDLPGDFFPCKKPKSTAELWYTNPSAFITLNRTISPSFDFALGLFTVDGNLHSSGMGPDGIFDFFDNFNDGSLTTPPTSYFSFPQPIEESGGFLRFRSTDGARSISRFGYQYLEDDAFLTYPLRDGYGNSEIMGVFRADVPEHTGQFYAIGIVNSGPELLESVAIAVIKRADGRIAVGVNDHTGTTIAGDFVTLPPNGFIIFKLFVDDALNEVYVSYSIDNGVTYKTDTEFGYFLRHGTVFNATPWMYVFAQGGVRISSAQNQ